MEDYHYVKVVSIPALLNKIRDEEGITIGCHHITNVGTSLTVYMKALLSSPEETLLDGIVNESGIFETPCPVCSLNINMQEALSLSTNGDIQCPYCLANFTVDYTLTLIT